MRRDDRFVLFDWGGVIDSNKPDTEYCNQHVLIDGIRYVFGVPMSVADDTIWRWIINSGYVELIDGPSSELAFKKELAKCLSRINYETKDRNFEKRASEFIEYALKHYSYVPYENDMLALAYETVTFCKTGIISDVNWLEARRLKMQVIVDLFDCTLLSYYEGQSKRGCGLFDVADKAVGKDTKVFLIDNSEENIEKAKQRGWYTMLFPQSNYNVNAVRYEILKFINDRV